VVKNQLFIGEKSWKGSQILFKSFDSFGCSISQAFRIG